MKLTLPNGMVLEGTEAQVIQTARLLGHTIDESKFYNSSTHGKMLITSMETTHLRNALLKMHSNWAESLKALHGRDLILALRNGLTDKTFLALIEEYLKRG